LKITNVRLVSGKELLAASEENPALRSSVERQIRQQLKNRDKLKVIEAVVIQDGQLNQIVR